MVASLVPVEHIAGPYSNQRLFEWCMAIMMMLISATLAMPGDTMERGALRPLLDSGFTEGNLSFFFGTFGALRALALAANGYINNGYAKPSGAVLRAIGAGAGAFIWSQMTLVLAVDAFHADSVSLFIPVTGTLLIFEVISCRRAKNDAVERARRTPLEDKIDELAAKLGKAGG